MSFKIVRKGYDKNEVDEYLFREKENNSEMLSRQKERIQDLIQENEELKKQLGSFVEGKSRIDEAVLLALEFKKNAENEIIFSKNAELSRLKDFKSRLEASLEKDEEYASLSKALSATLDAFIEELLDNISKSLGIAKYDYYQEAEREYARERERLSRRESLDDNASKLLSRLGITD